MKSSYAAATPRFVFAAAIFLACFASAQARSAAFHLGDRVMASPSSMTDEKYWRLCTVTAVHDFVPRPAYDLQCEATASSPVGSFLVSEQWVRAVQGAVASAAAAAPMHADAPPPAAARVAREASVACPASDADGGGAMERSIRGAIRHGFERPAAPGSDGAVTVNISALSIGQPHAYRIYSDPDEAKGKSIYPVRATFTTCTDYARRIVRTTRERAFACYEATPGAWACDITAAANTNVNDTTQSIDKQ